jgi:hypothetical protein
MEPIGPSIKILSYLIAFFKFIKNKIQLKLFFRKEKIEKSNSARKSKAFGIAQALTNESIKDALFFENHKDTNDFLLVLSNENDGAFGLNVRLFQKAGRAFYLVWENLDGLVHDSESVKIVDLLKDGHKQVFIFIESHGTGFGTSESIIFCTHRRKQYSIIESHNHSSMAYLTTDISIDIDQDLKNCAIDYAQKNGLMKEVFEVDLNNPKFAVNRWLKENGEKIQGQIRTYEYDGFPTYGASEIFKHQHENLIWISYFKGPLCLYDISRKIHYIVFAAKSGYQWITKAIGTNEFIFFTSHIPDVLMQFNEQEKTLYKFCEFNNEKIEGFEEVEGNDFISIKTQSG